MKAARLTVAVVVVDVVVVPAAADFGISLVTGIGLIVVIALTVGGFCRRALDVSIEILG